jgi:hypothetical protein
MRIVNGGNKNTKSLALDVTSTSHPRIWSGMLGSIQEMSKFAHVSGGSDWESLVKRRKVARMSVLYKAHNGKSVWKDIGDRLQVPH